MDKKALLKKIKDKQAGQSKAVTVSKKQENEIRQNPAESINANVYKKDIFETYVLWYSIPLAVKNLSQAARENLNLTELASELSQIRTKTEFAKTYGINRDTICEWEKKIPWKLQNQLMNTWLKMLTSNWRMALYKKAMRTGNAAEVKLLEQIVNDFSERSTSIEQTTEVYILAEDRKVYIKNLFKKNIHGR